MLTHQINHPSHDLLPLADLEALSKQKVKAKPENRRGASNIFTESSLAKDRKLIGAGIFKEISHQSLANH